MDLCSFQSEGHVFFLEGLIHSLVSKTQINKIIVIRAIVGIPTNYNRSTGKAHLTPSGDTECLFILVKTEVNIKEPEGCD